LGQYISFCALRSKFWKGEEIVEKIEQLPFKDVTLEHIWVAQLEILDWINAHDERNAAATELLAKCDKSSRVQDLCTKCTKSCKQYGGAELTVCGDYKPSVTEELGAGLKKMDLGKWYVKHGGMWCPCTYILLPMAKYEEYDEDDMGDVPGLLVFHDIPVFGLPIDSVVYGTEAI